MTESAALLADFTRWLGIGIAVLGAFLANPAATDHGGRASARYARAAGRRSRDALARAFPSLRHDNNTYPAGADRAEVALAGEVALVSRGLIGWGAESTADERFAILDARTKAHEQEIADLFTLVNKTKQVLTDDLAAAMHNLNATAANLRAHVDAQQQESVRTDASALPLIVVGVVLADLSSDAAKVQLWAWVLLLGVMVPLAGWSAWRVLRTWPGRP